MAYDDTCQLWIADIQGLGVASLILSIPHMEQKHWRYDLANQKPYLLNQQNKSYASHFPFPIQLLNKINQIDRITMSCFSQSVDYLHGMYDGIEREFHGFNRPDIIDSTQDAKCNTDRRSMPSLLRQWFYIGNINMTKQLSRQNAGKGINKHFQPVKSVLPNTSNAKICQLSFRMNSNNSGLIDH